MKVALFDVDGVLNNIEMKFFGVVYAKENNLPQEPIQGFFKTVFKDAVVGKADLKELLADNKSLWGWDGSVEDLLSTWFNFENLPNNELLEIIRQMQMRSIPCYVASVQEKYRAQYIKEKMFNNLDGYYFSYIVGAAKPDPEYFIRVEFDLKKKYPDLEPSDIFFVDDSVEIVENARKQGWDAHLYESAKQIERLSRDDG